jgi:tetratricopeptide (TPR) repeat protein
MSATRSRTLALCLSLIPGWGHVYLGREPLGLAIFTAAAAAGFGFLNGAFVYLGPWRALLTWGAAGVLGAILLATWVDVFRRTSRRRVESEASARERNLKEGVVAYLEGDLDRAAACFEESLDSDPLDVEALFRLGVVRSRAGKAREAMLCLRRTLKYDLEEKWRWEVERELARLREPAPARGLRRFTRKLERETEPHSA